MNDVTSIRELFQYMHWADAEVWRAVSETAKAAGDTLLRARLFHLHTVQHGFLAVWQRIPIDFNHLPKPEDFSNLRELAGYGADYHKKVTEYLTDLKEADMNATSNLPWVPVVEAKFGKTLQSTTLWDNLIQVAMHTQHHRGQVNTRVRELGGEPPTIDFIAWAWHGKPDAKWPEWD